MFFDFSCPYAYLASEVIEEVCARHGAALIWRPMLLGGVFRGVGGAQTRAPDAHWYGAGGEGDGPMSKQSALKAADTRRDALRWAARRGIPLAFPDAHPMRTGDGGEANPPLCGGARTRSSPLPATFSPAPLAAHPALSPPPRSASARQAG
jgi:hypothetical protein